MAHEKEEKCNCFQWIHVHQCPCNQQELAFHEIVASRVTKALREHLSEEYNVELYDSSVASIAQRYPRPDRFSVWIERTVRADNH
jgi:hypothetical protein